MEVYKISKLRKFMTTVNFIMQDSLRFLVLNSLSEFSRVFSTITSQIPVIKGASDVVFMDSNGKQESSSPPLIYPFRKRKKAAFPDRSCFPKWGSYVRNGHIHLRKYSDVSF